MTPGINALKKNNIAHKIHEYLHDSSSESYGLEAATKLGVPALQVFKTLVVKLDNKTLVVGVIPVSAMLSMKQLAKAAGAKKAEMAPPTEVERVTGYVLGGVSPLGQKQKLKTMVDASAENLATIFVSGGRRGLEIELSPNDLIATVGGTYANICQN